MIPRPLSVLFLSTGNAARSLIAEALLNAKKSDRFVARSAGFEPLDKPHPETLDLLRGHGFDVSKLHPKSWCVFQDVPETLLPDVVVTLSEEARLYAPTWPGHPVHVHWTVDDPLSAARADVREWKFRKCFSTLEARATALVRSRPVPTSSQLLLQLKDIGMVV